MSLNLTKMKGMEILFLVACNLAAAFLLSYLMPGAGEAKTELPPIRHLDPPLGRIGTVVVLENSSDAADHS